MAVAFIQTSNAASTASTNPISFLSKPTPGNFIVVAIGTQYLNTANEVSSVTDNGGNTYQKAISNTAASYPTCDIWYAENVQPTATATHTITVTTLGTGSVQGAVIQEFSGVAYSASLDKTASNVTNTGTNIDSGTTANTTQTDELIIVVGCQHPAAVTLSVGTGYSNFDYDVGNQTPVGMESKVVNAFATQNGFITSNRSINAVGLIATFKATHDITTTSTSSTSSSTSHSTSSTSVSSTSSSISSTSSSTSISSSTSTTTTIMSLGFQPRATIRQWGWK